MKRFRTLLSPGLPAIVLLSFGILLWSPVLLSRKTLFFDLILRYFYPMAAFFRGSLRQGSIPLWNPHILCGMPFLANPQTGVLYPPEWLFLIFPFPRALSLFILAHTLLAGGGMYYLARAYRLNTVSSTGAAVLFMGNGFFVMHAAFPSNIAACAWMPLVILFFLRAYQAGTFNAFSSSAALFTLQFLSGYPGFVYYTALFCAVAAIFFPLEGGMPARRFARAAVSTAFIAAGFSMILLLPLAELARFSVRGAGLDPVTAATYAIRASDYLRFLFIPFWDRLMPFYAGDVHIVGFYWGVAALALVFIRSRLMNRRALLFFGASFVLASLLALGPATPAYTIFYSFVPGWRFFGFPAQVMAVTCVVMSFLAAFALETLPRNAHRWIFTGIIALELAVFAWHAHRVIDDRFFDEPVPSLSFLRPDKDIFRVMITPGTRSLQPQGDENYFRRWLTYKDMLYPNTGSAYGISYVDGNETLQLARTSEYLSAVTSPFSPLLDLADMKYLISRKPLPGARFTPVHRGYTTIFLNRGRLPRFFLVSDARVLPSKDVLPYMISEKFDPAREVVLEELDRVPEDDARSPSAREGNSSVSCERYAPNEVQCHVSAAFPQWLVASEAWYPGWRAEIDGDPVKLYRADHAFRAIRVPKGEHRVRMSYRPVSLMIGALVSLAAVITVLAGIIMSRRGKRNQ